MGRLAVEACLAAARGRKVPARIDAPIQVVTARTVRRVEKAFPRPPVAFHDPVVGLLGD
jgi:hypothetical protein